MKKKILKSTKKSAKKVIVKEPIDILQTKIEKLVYGKHGLGIGEIIGVLELIKMDLHSNALEDQRMEAL